MDVSGLEWGITIAITCAVLLSTSSSPATRTSPRCASARSLSSSTWPPRRFGIWTIGFHGTDYGIDFYTGFIVEKSLSVDNLFVFIVLMSALKVPRSTSRKP